MSSDNDIRKQFQEKFSDFKAGVPADGWDRLEKALNAAPVVPMPRRRWRYATSAVAGVLLLIVGSLLFVQRPWDQAGPMLTESAVPVASSQKGGTPSTEPDRIVQSESTSVPATVGTRADALLVAEVRPHQEAPVGLAGSAEITVPKSYRERIERAISEVDGRKLRALVTPMDCRPPMEERLVAATGHEGLLASGHDLQNNREPILLAMSGRGGLSSYQQTVNTPMTLRSASTAADVPEENKKNLLVAQNTGDNVAEMEHDQPVSFGITVSKAIIEDLYIETGLVYSYLHSKTRNENTNFQVKETQRLHYIGVPLNINYNVFSLDKLNIYASIGGMVEKDVYGDFRRIGEGETVDFNSRSEETEITKISQRNPQVSVNAGVGLSYPVYNRLRLYGKVGGAYYFDAKNEHKTIYSDRKTVMDLNVGLRYEF